jgi:thiamine pyrophosphate-dependent acetolactate synthase large subunit-like protein
MADRDEPVHAVALGEPDLVAVARALGCHAEHVTDVEALPGLLAAAFAADRPTLLHLWEDSRAARGMRKS